jgi:lipopolysaccharide/colanic/teichoic acid biosynthesis glycosyltransferase
MGDRRKSPARAPVWEAVVRRAIDIVVATVVLLLTLPILLVLALWIRHDSQGPALYRHQRIGLGGKAFTMYKFRSMRLGCDDRDHRALIAAELRGEDTSQGGSTKVSNDSRVTRPGRLLRRTSLDELPQLLNVLRGEMSLVGPRPCLDWEADMFPPQYVERFSVRPGLTGLWQVRGRSTVGTLDMLRMDMEYVRNRGLRLDLFILLATVATLLKANGAR